MDRAIELRSCAKINLYLEVLGRRADGFHDIETVFQTVSLHDSLRFEARTSGLSLTSNVPSLDCGESNLVIRAARLLQHAAGVELGAAITLTKNIPIAAGLAGGSGNAAAALAALNALWNTALTSTQLEALAAKLGSDVPYCLRGGTVIGGGRGEILEPVDPLPRTWFILVHPGIAISAASAYTSPHLTYADDRAEARGKTLRALDALRRGDYRAALFNRLEAPVFAAFPELAGIKQRLDELGCAGSLMSGSGSTVFGVCRSEDEARSIANRLGAYDATVVRSVDHGLEYTT